MPVLNFSESSEYIDLQHSRHRSGSTASVNQFALRRLASHTRPLVSHCSSSSTGPSRMAVNALLTTPSQAITDTRGHPRHPSLLSPQLCVRHRDPGSHRVKTVPHMVCVGGDTTLVPEHELLEQEWRAARADLHALARDERARASVGDRVKTTTKKKKLNHDDDDLMNTCVSLVTCTPLPPIDSTEALNKLKAKNTCGIIRGNQSRQDDDSTALNSSNPRQLESSAHTCGGRLACPLAISTLCLDMGDAFVHGDSVYEDKSHL